MVGVMLTIAVMVVLLAFTHGFLRPAIDGFMRHRTRRTSGSATARSGLSRTSAWIVLLLLTGVPFAEARCKTSLKRTCVRTAFRCFNPKGACIQQNVTPPDGPSMIIRCWANGAREVNVLTGSTAGIEYSFDYDVTLINSRGAVCATGSWSYRCHTACGGTGTYAYSLSRGKKTWRWEGTMFPERLDVTCASGRRRSLSVEFASSCADTTACQPGTCT